MAEQDDPECYLCLKRGNWTYVSYFVMARTGKKGAFLCPKHEKEAHKKYYKEGK